MPSGGRNAWKPQTLYGLADFEPIWRLDDGCLQQVRVRGGLGYVLDRAWRVELLYHAAFSGAKGEPKEHTDNVWRLSFRWSPPVAPARVRPRP